MIIEPCEKQHPTVQKLELNVKKLEEVTMEAISNWFNDKDHPENAQKRPFLKEIFKIAKAEERYRNGEIGELHLLIQLETRNPKLTFDRWDHRDSCDVWRKVLRCRW
jgi:Zn-dependent M32 family carboxypeptidase